MCGIVGYVGKKEAQPILLAGLKKLEYRGYDSSGLAILDQEGLQIAKTQGKLDNLEAQVGKKALCGQVGIGHTRWATHGRPSDQNAHPHVGPEGKIAVVHNGIVENYMQIKEQYLAGHTFASETDTEVIAHLLEKFYQGNLENAVREMLKVVHGAYALGIVCADEPDKIIACRKDSPLVLGLGEGENFIASDVPALLAYTRECLYIEEHELCILTSEGIVIKDQMGKVIEKAIQHIEWDAQSAEKSGFDHFMLKEIYEQPEAFRRTLSGRIKQGKVHFSEFQLSNEMVDNWRKIYIVACGTAYHAGLVGKTILETMTKIPVEVEVASEFRYRSPMLDEETLVIVISQSGETADTVAALREAKAHGSKVMAITNVVASAIAREADYVVYLWAGPEISVASTKAYTTMLVAQYLLGLYLAQAKGSLSQAVQESVVEGLEEIANLAQSMLTTDYIDQIQRLAADYKGINDLFFIGRGLDWAIALEGALKLKEISYIHAEAYAAGELKHGTLALVTPETPIIALCVQESTYEKTISNIKEVKARDASVLAIINEGDLETEKCVDAVLTIPRVHNLLSPVLAVIPLQLIAYYTAALRGCHIDQPRNLAKSVTVE